MSELIVVGGPNGAGETTFIKAFLEDNAHTYQAASAERVRIRVKKSGHNVPDKDIERRFLRTHTNFWNLYRGVADRWTAYNISGWRSPRNAHHLRT